MFTILQNYGTMDLRFTIENYGTMVKIMVEWTKLWYYTEKYWTSIYEGENIVYYQKLKKLWFIMGKTMEMKFVKRFIALELWFTMEKLWYYEKN